ncbi:MAG: EF-P beta-lysylation protein EpmB [Gammaproteobacteria bacterium]
MINPIASWQHELSEAFSNIDELCQYLAIKPSSLPILPQLKDFPLRVPRGFAERMQKGNPNDPLLLQVLPLQKELQIHPGYTDDPVGDLNAVAETGVIHKYHGRVLLVTTGACAVHCRYCFRRHFPYGELQLSVQKIEKALGYISAHADIKEVILSGGDPLLLGDHKLFNLLQQLAKIQHVQRIRIHSRIPVVLPSRMTEHLLQTVTNQPQKIILVLHANHPAELNEEVRQACQRIRKHEITLLNQSVLLKGINDNSEVLLQLSERLFDLGVLPYYLHCLDRAAGVAHFEVLEHEAKRLLQALQEKLPGYLIPKLVMEQAGALHKIRIA